jgi:FkbM family methyltransferase
VIETLTKFGALLRGVRNPWPAFLDRFGLMNTPYVLRLRDGSRMELRPKRGDLFGFYEIMLRGDYTRGGQSLRPGDQVIDVGANVGCFTLLAARRVGPTGRVIAVEPEESTYRQLVRNVEINGLTNVLPIHAAIGASEGTATLRTNTNALFSSLYSSVNQVPVAGGEQRVPMTTLEKLMDSHGIQTCAYLKLDCEGAEHDIVRTMTRTLAGRVKQITLELHAVPGVDAGSLQSKLVSLGYANVARENIEYYSRPDEAALATSA